MGLEAAELARWTRFAAKGGIGKCIATCDCVAESPDDLMFLKDDEITVLLQLPDREGFYLGYCEGVVGRFAGQDVHFTTKLKKPVMTKRSSSMGTVTSNINKSPSPTVSASATSPSPTPHTSISYNPQHGVTHRTSSTPSPSAFRSMPVSGLNSRTRAESLERRGSGIGARHAASPLSTARALAPDNEAEERRAAGEGEPIPNAFATLHEMALAEAAASGSGGQPRQGSVGSRKEYQYTASPFGTPSPREAQFSRVDSSSERGDSRAGTRTSSPRQGFDSRRQVSIERAPPQGPISSSSSQPLSTSTSTSSTSFAFTTTTSSSSSSPHTSPPSSPPRSLHTQPHNLQQHRYTAHAPSPLTLHPDQHAGNSMSSNSTSPLRITKRSPGPSPALGFGANMNSNVQQMQSSPPPTTALPLVPGSPPAGVHTHSGNASISLSQTLAAPVHSHSHGLSPSVSTFSTVPGLSPSTAAFSPLSSPSVYSSPPQSAAPTLASSSSSPSHTATFAHRLGLSSPHGSSASFTNEDRYKGDTVGSSPATLSHEDRDIGVSLFSTGDNPSPRQSGSRFEDKAQVLQPRDTRDASATAAGVSIGLSLLEGLIGNYSDDEDDSDEDDDRRSQNSDQGDNTMRTSRQNRVSTVSRESVTASEEGTAEGLGYARSEESHALHNQGRMTNTQPLALEHSRYGHNQAENVRSEPTPHATQQASQPEPHLLSPTTSPTSPSFPARDTQSTSRERRPSLAPSASSVYSARSGASASTGASARTSSWEGASDIYDDYRYSRASMRPSFDAMSVRSGAGGVSGGGERRPSFDSVGSGAGGHFAGMGRRERMDSGASSSFGGMRLGGLIESVEGDDGVPSTSASEAQDAEAIEDAEQDASDNKDSDNGQDRHMTLTDIHANRLSEAHRRTASVDSDVSVYTQNSRLSTLSRDLALGGVLAGLASPSPQGQDKDHSESEDQNNSPHARTRPPPLALGLSASEPLLHTTWGSAVSSPAMSPPATSVYTPVAGVMEVAGRGLYSPGGGGSQRSVGVGIGTREDEEGGLKSPTTIAGFASAMRLRLEEDRLARTAETQENSDTVKHESHYENTGLGNRIVIEDEDELPSRIANETFDSQASTTESVYLDGDSDPKGSFTSADSQDTHSTALRVRANSRTTITPSSSPEPEILGGLGMRLGGYGAPLVITNRTPSPSFLDGASNDGRLDQTEVAETSTDAEAKPIITISSTTGAAAAVPPPVSSQALSSSLSPAPSAPSHLRPSLADLREPTGAPLPGTNQRRSLFLPHPNAPKAPEGLVSPGPMYIAAQQQAPGRGGMYQGPPSPGSLREQSQGGMAAYSNMSAAQNQHMQHIQQQLGAPRLDVLSVIQMALARPPPPAGPARVPHQKRGPTIYGRTEAELGAALGPVPIMFSIEPPPPGTGNGPAGGGHGQGKGSQSRAPPTSPPRVQMMAKGGPAKSQVGQQTQPVPRSMSVGPGVAIPSASGSSATVNSNSMPPISNPTSIANSGPGNATNSGLAVPGVGDQKVGPIPRANFFPKAPGLRPRSRSFSGFNSTNTEVPVPLQRSREDTEIPSAKEVHRSLTARASSASLSSSRSQPSLISSSLTSANSVSGGASSQIKSGSAPLRSSPLSLSPLSGDGGLKPSSTSPILKSPSSPLAQSFVVPPTSQVVTAPQSPEISLSPPPINANLGGGSVNASDVINSKATHQLRDSPSRATLNEALLRSPPSIRSKPPFDATSSLASSGPGRTASLQVNSGRTGPLVAGSSARPSSPHSMMDLGTGEPQAQISQLPSIGRQTSLRSKLSLPNLRRKQSRQDDDHNTIASPTSPISLGPSIMHDPEMLQVKDMEFELVRPNLAHHFSQAARTSEDSAVLGREGSFDLRQESSSFLRAESPALSMSSGGGGGGSSMLVSGQRSPTIDGGWNSQAAASSPASPPPGASRPPTDSESSMDAHRQREQKWMTLMAANPAANARKSKKVRKLVIEGVPSSVRYLVWSYLTDGKARWVPGVYAQLCARGKVGVADRIEEDIKRGFGAIDGEQEQLYSHLRGTQGPVGTLLSAYLNMVPDVQYSIGLTLIVGQLLLLAPEEDAFWTFVSIMDTHIRPYFSSSTTQMEVDAALFSRALENNDAQLAKKVLVDMGILPTAICQPWFSTLFVGTLPPEYLNRVWDLFLFEGVPFLVRVALALMQCCRRRILESTSDQSVFHILRHPSASLLPPTPDAFLALAFGVKHKDDDMRKQRVKMEAQVKRQTQVPRTASTSGMISLPRT